MTPFDKAILWAIGIGNYNASEIYEEEIGSLKSGGAQQGNTLNLKRNFMNSQFCLKKAERA